MNGRIKAKPSRGSSLIRLAATTPLRDVLRGRLTGRLDVDRVVAEGDLPGPVSELIRRVVRRTRLWRLERTDVARELVAHFCDGLEQEHNAEHLIDSFGDERVAARLIRRGTKRKRPIAWRAARRTVQTTGAFVALMVVIYLALALRYYTGRPKISRDYLAQLNAPIRAIPESQRAWPIYRQAYLSLEVVPEEIDNAGGVQPAVLHDPVQRARVSAYLARNSEAIALIRRAASMPHLGRVLSHEPDPKLMARFSPSGYQEPPQPPPAPESLVASLFGVLLPEMGIMREFARVLASDAVLSTGRSDEATAADDLEALLGLVRHVGEEPFLISDLVRMAVFALQLQTLGVILADDPDVLADEHLLALSHRIAALGREGRVADSLRTERMTFEDIVQRVYTDDGHGNGRVIPNPNAAVEIWGVSPEDRPMKVSFTTRLIGPITSAVAADRKSILATYGRMMDAALQLEQTPQWRWTSTMSVDQMLGARSSRIAHVRYLWILSLAPAFQDYISASKQASQRRDAMLVVLALEIYRRRHGQYPASLDDLVPDLLPAVPPDRFTGGAIGYRRTGDRAVVYSVGVDRDDDGGVPPPGTDGNVSAMRWRAPDSSGDDRPIPDGDWVLWPPIIPESRAGVGGVGQTRRSDD